MKKKSHAKRGTHAAPEHPLFRAERELATDQQRVDWMLRFANQSDVEKLSQDEVDEIHEYLFAFAANRQPSFGTKEELPRSAAALYAIQDALRSGLRQAIRLDDRKVHGFAGWEVALDSIGRRVMRGQSSYQGPLRAVFLAAVADLIAADNEKRFEECVRSTCRRFFWRRGSTKYCSKLCADADRQRRWRRKHLREET